MKKTFTPLISSLTHGMTILFQVVSIAIMLLLPYVSGAQTTTISVSGQSNRRTIFVHAPTGLAQNRPLVISIHGLGGNINEQKAAAKWELVADTARFVVVYPAGEGNSWDIGGNKDTDFISAIIESMVARYGIDRNRVYVTGHSMGGMMSYHVANKIANKVAAIGPVGGYLFSNIVASSRPMPIIHVHSTGDNVVYYNPSGNQQGVKAMLQKWRNWNKCPSTGTRTTPYPVNKPNSKSVMEYWGPCNNSAVQLVTIDGKGHWHVNDPAGVNTTHELWMFFKKQSLKTGTVTGIEADEAFESTVFPNPFKDVLSIQMKGGFSYQLLSTSGLLISEGVGKDLIEMNDPHQKGLYLLKIQQGDKSKIIKVLKE